MSRLSAETTRGPVGLSFHEFLLAGKRGKESTDNPSKDNIHIQRLRVLREAERLGNVSEACRRHGMSRTLFCRLRARLEQYGPDGVHPKRRQARRGRPSGRVIEVLTQLVSVHGAPRYLRSDYGPEFVARAILRWLQTAQIETVFIDPGKPWQNGADESFNGKFRDQHLSPRCNGSATARTPR